MNLRLMAMLPQLFKSGSLILKQLEGGITPEEMVIIVKEIRELVASVPELGAFLGIFDVLVKVAIVVLPTFLGDKAKILALGLQEEQVEQAMAVSTLLNTIINEAVVDGQAAQNKVTLDDVEDLI